MFTIVDSTVENAGSGFTDKFTTQFELGFNSAFVLELSSKILICGIVQLD